METTTTDNHIETLMRVIVEQFRQLGQPTLYEQVLRVGRRMTIQPLTIAEARTVAELARRLTGHRGVNSFEIKQCYHNSQKLITEHEFWGPFDPGVTVEYCEGYTNIPTVPGLPLAIDHAWLLVNGKVVDVTLRRAAKRVVHDYFGLTVPVELLHRHQLRTKFYCSVIEGPFQLEALGLKPRRRRRAGLVKT